MSRRGALAGRRPAGETLKIVLDDLVSLTSTTDPEIESLTRTFEKLAGQSSRILGLASKIVECIEDDGVRSVLPTVRALGSAGISFVESRLRSNPRHFGDSRRGNECAATTLEDDQKPVWNRVEDPSTGHDDQYRTRTPG